MLVDTHAHLTAPELLPQVDQVIERAEKAGVTKIICASSNLEDSKQAIELAKKYPRVVYASAGLHPHDTSPDNPQPASRRTQSPQDHIRQLFKLAEAPEVVAIGECGLDFTPPPPGERERPREEQVYVFKEQVKLAIRLGKPLIIHSRKAFEETVEILREHNDNPPPESYVRQLADGSEGEQQNTPGEGSARPWGESWGESNPHWGRPEGHPRCDTRGVFHCYSAGKKGLEAVNNLGFYFGVDGNLTYDEGLQNVFREIPLNKILLETDAPWLAPVPHRGSASEPAYVRLIAEVLAKQKKTTFKRVAQETGKNAAMLFSLD